MKNPLRFIILAAAIAFFLPACGMKEKARVIFTINAPESKATTETTPSDVTQIIITVSAADMETMSETLDLTAGGTTSAALVVSKGEARTFTAQALDTAGEMMYEGSTIMDILEDTVSLSVDVIYKGPGVYDYHVYLANWVDDFLSTGDWDDSSGSFTTDGPSVSFTESHGIAIHPNGKYAYVSSFTNGLTTVTNATIDQTTGGLTLTGTSSTGDKPTSIAIHPTLPVAYISCINTGRIYVHSINSDGTIGTGSPVTTASSAPHRISITPDGTFLYVANEDDTVQVQIFSINQNDGSLTYSTQQISANFAANCWATGVSVHPNGLWVYVSYFNTAFSTGCSRWIIDSNGDLISELKVLDIAARYFEAVEVGPLGNYIYFTNTTDDVIEIYSIDQTTGNLSYVETKTPTLSSYLHTNVAVGKITIREAGAE